MKCFVGIDLGSTTTKAVVLDPDGSSLGRGITNSRSNYDVACEVARSEALMDARFNLFGNRISRHTGLTLDCDALLEAVRRAFRFEQYVHLLGELEAVCRMNAERSGSTPGRPSVPGFVLDELFRSLEGKAAGHFASGAKRRSDFFRDIAGSDYMAEAQRLAREHDIDYERLLAVYDKSIIAVESHVPSTFLEHMIERALESALDSVSIAPGLADGLRRDIEKVVGIPLIEATTVGTGYGRARLPFPQEYIRSEILCHGLGAHAIFPATRTVLDIGGQDTKAIQVDGDGIVTSFQMNDRCAAGCGRYLGYIADEMNLGLHELGPLAMTGKRPVRINSTCTVFAGAELRDRLAMGQRREDILAGLHRAIMLRAMSLLARSGGVRSEFTFTGGVANNEAAVTALRQLIRENYSMDHVNVSPDSIYMGALGAAIFALRAGTGVEGALAGPLAAGGVA